MKESKPAMILRLLAEAEQGKFCHVSLRDGLEFRRDQYGLTKSQFAALLGVSLGRYGEVLSGKRELGFNPTRRAYAIGVSAEVLLQTPKEKS